MVKNESIQEWKHPYISIARGIKSSPSVHSTYDCIFSWTTIIIAWTIVVDACYTISIQVGSTMTMSIKRTYETPIFISHHVVCSLISFCCCNHLRSMLMTIKIIVIHLELNNIGHKLVFHSYSKSTSNMWYTLICKFEKCKPNPKKNYMGMNKYHLLDFFWECRKIEK
jgi:hypothetical protein